MGTLLNFKKGNYDVDVHAEKFSESFKNKIFDITPAQTQQNQSSGPKETKLVDLLRIKHQIKIKAWITPTNTKTAKQVKKELIKIHQGGETDGGTIEMTYDGDTYSGIIESLTIDEESDDANDSNMDEQQAKYQLDITFIEGNSI